VKYIAKHQSLNGFADHRHLVWVLLLVAAIVQLPPLLCGFELCDSGFYMTFYDNIFTHPEAVEYNFMYYLSGLAGGVVSAVTAGSVLAIRIFGAVCNVACVWLAYDMVRRWGRVARQRGSAVFVPVLLSVLIIGTASWSAPLAFYNDTLTVLLAMVSLRLLCVALVPEVDGDRTVRCRLLILLFSGIVAGVNAFSRLPNILEVFFVCLLLLAPARALAAGGCGRWRASLVWLGGWLGGVAAVLALAAALGHIPVLENMVHDLVVTVASPAGASSHGFSHLLSALVGSWYAVGRTALPLLLIYVVHLRWHSLLVNILTACVVVWLLLRVDVLTAIAAVSVSGAVAGLVRFRGAGRTILWSVLAMLAILPLGSDNGFYNFGAVIFWLSLPVSFAVFGRRLVPLSLVVTVCLVCGGVRSLVVGGMYFDDTPLSEMTGSINSPSAAGIRTSPERARRVNAMVSAVRRHVAPGDTLLVYGSAPMLNHLTATVPAIGCSWPELLTPGLLDHKLGAADAPANVLLLRFRTLGSEWGSGSDAFMAGDSVSANLFHNPEKSGIMLAYLSSGRYYVVEKDSDFILFSRRDSVSHDGLSGRAGWLLKSDGP